MSTNPRSEDSGSTATWLVGSSYGGDNDQTIRFVMEGIWKNGHRNQYNDEVKSIQPGNRIAIKSSYTRTANLPFNNRGQTVSVMAIKATGTVIENAGDGKTLKVDWTLLDPPREWYFYTNRRTVWRVLPGDWITDALIAFTFEGARQDIERFRNAPQWRDRYGDTARNRSNFSWTTFYEDVADHLILFRNKRDQLVTGIHAIASKVDGLSIANDRFKGGTTGPLKDICPFTTMGTFNRQIKQNNRQSIARELARLIGATQSVPDSFDGIPVLDNRNSWFFDYDEKRNSDDIDALWEVFAEALKWADPEDTGTRSTFISAYDNAMKRSRVGWKLTMGLFWIRPWRFPTLDSRSRDYIEKHLNSEIGKNGPKGRSSATDYVAAIESLRAQFGNTEPPFHSFPGLSHAAWLSKDDATSSSSGAAELNEQDDARDPRVQPDITPSPADVYSVDDIIKDGCFMEREAIDAILERLRAKKNLILQGPPGTGKTWLAKRLAFALIGRRDDSRVRAVQFHPTLSYEDFIRGWRPAGDGKLTLVDGAFMEIITASSMSPRLEHVMVIEEINRGNPAQIFGEMLTLLEAEKRAPDEALELSYRRSERERVFVPDNLFVIGTMNIADRSLALVDIALRRRFAFVGLEPALGTAWHEWVKSKCGIDSETLREIESRLKVLNRQISSDAGLGPQFQVGHSYVTPPSNAAIPDGRAWFREVVATEIGPLLDEYWFDAHDKSQKARQLLLEGF